MSLNQKYTWASFLRENPAFKAKGIKRTSAEGKKAFETTYKSKIREILKSRLGWIERELARVEKEREALTSDMKAAKKGVVSRRIQSHIGRKDKYLHRLGKLTTKTKQVQKGI